MALNYEEKSFMAQARSHCRFLHDETDAETEPWAFRLKRMKASSTLAHRRLPVLRSQRNQNESKTGNCKTGLDRHSLIQSTSHILRQFALMISHCSELVLVVLSNHIHITGVSPQLSGFVCAFNPAALGLSPKHTIYACINLYLNCIIWKQPK